MILGISIKSFPIFQKITTGNRFFLALKLMKILFKSNLFFLLIINASYAQLPVSKEPRHHKVFENDYVRVLDVHVVPGDTTLFHKHETPSVFIVLTNAKTGSELISDGTVTNPPVTYGNIWFDGFYIKPRIHRVWNNDTIEFHVMDIELLNKSYKDIGSDLQQKSIQILFNEKPVIGYSCLLNAHTTLDLTGRKCPILAIELNDNADVTINDKIFKQKGDFIFIPENSKSVFINNSIAATQLAIFELK